MNKNINDIIQDTARATAREVVRQQRCLASTNLYRATEKLLRNYKTLARLLERKDEYMLIPEHDKSITVAPPPGGVPKDKAEILQEKREERSESYRRTADQFYELDNVVQQFKDRKEFIAIRMYYFGEDVYGNGRGPDDRPRSWEEISEELEDAGMHCSERTLRTWRTNLVQDMTVALFGVDGAVSLQAPREKREGNQ